LRLPGRSTGTDISSPSERKLRLPARSMLLLPGPHGRASLPLLLPAPPSRSAALPRRGPSCELLWKLSPRPKLAPGGPLPEPLPAAVPLPATPRPGPPRPRGPWFTNFSRNCNNNPSQARALACNTLL
jgi:hypothetical protein